MSWKENQCEQSQVTNQPSSVYHLLSPPECEPGLWGPDSAGPGQQGWWELVHRVGWGNALGLLMFTVWALAGDA